MAPVFQGLADTFGANVDSFSRNLVNAFVALAVGGPLMYATFTRTALDHDFAQKHPRLLWSSLLIPVIVVALALINLPLLLTVFFLGVDPCSASDHLHHRALQSQGETRPQSVFTPDRLWRDPDLSLPACRLEDIDRQLQHWVQQPERRDRQYRAPGTMDGLAGRRRVWCCLDRLVG